MEYQTAIDRYKQCGEVLLTIAAELDSEKKRWRELPRRWRDKNKELKPCTVFADHVRQKLSFSEDKAYHYIAIAENCSQFKLWECKTLREALEKMGRIQQKSATVETRIQLEEKHQNDLDLLSSNPESQIVDADLVPRIEFVGQKKKWRELNQRQKEKPENRHLKPCIGFGQHVTQNMSFEVKQAYHYIAIAENWEKFKLWECETLREALEKMGRIKQKSATAETLTLYAMSHFVPD